ncbi:hypothetical protein [Psychrobacillus sp. FSL H8-0510]|uniref:hypothetical protein n=1 Tax=Psychrobacillus sp. FSL H8-0510 TaxID=2921394 RepID=UPI0030F50DB7
MEILEVVVTLISIHLIGGLLWFVFYMGNMLTNQKEKKVFQQLVASGSSKKYSANFVRLALILTGLVASLLYWEVSAARTIKKSYKNFLPKN